jgi:pantoate--beta-alanine ligase
MSVETRPEVCASRDETRRFVRNAQSAGKRVGVVMTMGALHEGHLSLIDACAADCDISVVTIFVNPTQFGRDDDFREYPRNLDDDMRRLTGHGVHLVFAPDPGEMYRAEHSTIVQPPDIADRIEGPHRPGHFSGVATIVLKLMHIVPADVAFFGQKDYQQCLVIRNMVEDLDMSIEIVVCPTVRDEDGLARSSRNQYLSQEQRHKALAISAALRNAQALVANGETDVAVLVGMMEQMLQQAGIDKIDYVEIADVNSLMPLVTIQQPAIAMIAAHFGSTRLIDNMMLEPR